MPTQNLKDFNPTNSVDLRTDSVMALKNEELVRLNGSNTIISGVNELSVDQNINTNKLRATGEVNFNSPSLSFTSPTITFTSKPTISNVPFLLSGEAPTTSVEMAQWTYTPNVDQNLGLNVDIYPIWNRQRYNSNINVFELYNSGLFSPNPVPRIGIKQPGYYQIGFQYYGYDMRSNNRVTLKLQRASTINGGFSLVEFITKTRPGNTASDGDTVEGFDNIFINSANTGFYSVSFLSTDLDPYTIVGHESSFGISTFTLDIIRLRGV